MKRCPPPWYRDWYRAAFAALLVSLMALSAFAQIQSSTLFGNVVGNDGGALPGVTVTLTGVGAPAVTVTDEQGRFRFPNLSPGTYTLRAELAGYGTATRAGIGVRLGASPDVTLTLNPSVAQTITVTAEAPLLDVRKTGTGATISKVELESVPSGRDPTLGHPGVRGDHRMPRAIGGLRQVGARSPRRVKVAGGDLDLDEPGEQRGAEHPLAPDEVQPSQEPRRREGRLAACQVELGGRQDGLR